MAALFEGTGTALSTPYHADGSIDYDSFGRLIDMQIAAGVEALIPCGSTGESATMTHDEKLQVIGFTLARAKQHGANRPKIVAGTGSNVTHDTIELTKEAQALGVDGVLLVSPYYNKPSQRGIIAHFGAVAEAAPELPLVLYNVPARTGSNMTAATTVELARRYSNIVAVKEASADLDQCSAIIRDAPDGFVLYSGEDSLTLPLLAMGAHGVIAVISNEVPKDYGDMVRLALAGNFAEARKLHLKLFELMKLNFIESNPVPVKEALAMMGIFSSVNYRQPLVPLADENRAELRSGLERLGLVEEGIAVNG
jgi:4-hydroxy-tetrahydrodipicolinate synthase